MSDPYDGDYFLRGKETGKSLYTDYRWMPELTIPMCKAIAEHLGMKQPASILDFGCARGYVVKAFRQLKFEACGVDLSEWAIKNCDPEVIGHVYNLEFPPLYKFDYVLAKDVLEHIPEFELDNVIQSLFAKMRRGMLVVVPLSPGLGEPYTVPDYEKDITHQIRWPLTAWLMRFNRYAGDRWLVRGCYRLPGVKDNYYDDYPLGNGFITVTEKIPEKT